MKRIVLALLLVFVIAFGGCASKKDNSEATTAKTEVTATTAPTKAPAATPTTAPTSTPVPTVAPTAVPTIALPKDAVVPITKNDTGKVLIQTVSSAQDNPFTAYIITSVNGESVVVDPYQMPRKKVIDLNPAAIVNTHSHYDHNDAPFNKDYPNAAKLALKIGEVQTKDFHIYSIAASHNGDQIPNMDYPSDSFIVFEVDGLRIAHLGDCGQTVLTEDQLKELGEIDIAFTQFENSYSDMSLENEKGFKLIEQLNPKIVIPTHYSENTLPILEKKYGKITEFENILEISKEDLPKGTLNPYRILNTHKYK